MCSQFEFVNSRTLWGDNVEPITESNIDAKAKMIVDQYKKKAALFKTGNNVLIPLGDDFKYFDQNYMDTMTKNFDPLFKYINDNRAKFKVGSLEQDLVVSLVIYCTGQCEVRHVE